MNRTILEQLRRTQISKSDEDVRKTIEMIKKSGVADSRFSDYIANEDILAAVSGLAMAYTQKAVARATVNSESWEGLLGGNDLAIGTMELEGNPALIFFAQAVMLIAAAVLKEGVE